MWLVRRAYEHFVLVFTLTIGTMTLHYMLYLIIYKIFEGDLKEAYRSHSEELFKREYKPGNL